MISITRPMETMPHLGETHVHAEHGVQGMWLAVGRALFGGYFLFSGIHHFTETQSMAAWAASKGVPSPELAVMASGALIVLGGLSLLLGLWPRLGAAMIVLFLVGVTPMMHNFWAEAGAARMNDMANFLKNVALFGGACIAAALPTPWPGSVHAPHAHPRAA